MASASAAHLPVDLVEEIFLRLDDTADLVRASAACAAFRRVVSDGRFLRRWKSLHRRPVLGGLRFSPAAPPRRSAQAALAVARAAALSFSFLPANPSLTLMTKHCWQWHVHDVRDGRVLLSPGDATTCWMSFPYLVVYDPLHRKHVEIPPITTDMVACRCSWNLRRCTCQFDPFLIPAAADADDDKDDLSFRVMCTVLSSSSADMGSEYKGYDFVLETLVYSSATGKWRRVASLTDADYDHLPGLKSRDRHYAHGCVYWACFYSEKDEMLVLDMNEMKFTVVRLPPGTMHRRKVVVEAAAAGEEDRIGLLVLWRNTLDLYTKALGAASGNDCWAWRRDGVVTLPDSYRWFFAGKADQGYALLVGIPQQKDEFVAWNCSPEEMGPKTEAHYFTVELQTLVAEQLCVTTKFDPDEPAFMYAGFPPPFAPPSLRNTVCINQIFEHLF